MTYYLDASVLVAAVTDEPDRMAIQAWLRNHETNLAVSSWVLTEAASALSIKVRRGEMTETDKSAANGQIELMRDTLLLHVAVEEAHFFAARRFADLHQTGLRGGDALHAAIAADYGFTLVTSDKGLMKGARFLGLDVELLAGLQ